MLLGKALEAVVFRCFWDPMDAPRAVPEQFCLSDLVFSLSQLASTWMLGFSPTANYCTVVRQSVSSITTVRSSDGHLTTNTPSCSVTIWQWVKSKKMEIVGIKTFETLKYCYSIYQYMFCYVLYVLCFSKNTLTCNQVTVKVLLMWWCDRCGWWFWIP